MNYSLDEAMEIITKNLHDMEEKTREESYQSALKIHRALQELSELIREFSARPIPESAKASGDVKRRFCALSGSQLSGLEKPAAPAAEYTRSVRSLLDGLGGLTHRQLLHINFFFREDFKPVAKKISEINALMPSAGDSEHARAEALYSRLAQLEKRAQDLQASILANEEKLNGLKARQLPSLADEPVRGGIAEERLRSLKQEIDSFLAVQKLLKKYGYVQKINDELLYAYIESPSSALIKDDSLKIIKFIAEASALVKEGKLPPEAPGKKTESIINGSGYLARKRTELLEAAELAKKERDAYSRARERFEASLHARTNALAELESGVKQVNRLIEVAKKEQAETSSEISRTRVELCMLASKILGANVS